MAPTNKPSSSASKGTSNGNPAPDFAVNMNRIQTQLEARMKAARAFLPSRSDLAHTNAASSNGSFSALSAGASTSQSRDAAAAAAARRAAEEAEFAEERGLDPNAGIGLVPPNSAARNGKPGGGGEDQGTANLRGRLLGKRGRGDGDGQLQQLQKRARKEEESSDEEPGRSGLGRAKKNRNGSGAGTGGEKRVQVDVEMGVGSDNEKRKEDGQGVKSDTPLASEKSNGDDTEKKDDQTDDLNGLKGDMEDLTVEATAAAGETGRPLSEDGNVKKKRKKKRKKKPTEKSKGD